MAVILYSSALIIIDKAKNWHIVIVSVFLITQAVFGNCIITTIENIVRPIEGMITVDNYFILHSVTGDSFTAIGRLVFMIIGLLLIKYYILDLENKKTPKWC